MNFTGHTANMEKWYDHVKDFTAESRFLKIDDETRNWLIAKTYQVLCHEMDYFSERHAKPYVTVMNGEEVEKTLIQSIDEVLGGETLFFRTNLCSPKDVQQDCRVSSGKEAIDLLTASHRMYQGYPRIQELDFYFVFRQWIPDMEKEFRCFIADGKIIGISQYDDSNTVSKGEGASVLYDWQDEDYLSVYRYTENIIRETNIQFAVVDLASTPNGFWLLEINPFDRSTDKCLFYHENLYEEFQEDDTEIRFWKKSHLIQKLFINDAGKIIRKEQEEIKKNELDLSKLMFNLDSFTQKKE